MDNPITVREEESPITARTDYDYPILLDLKRVEVQTTGSKRVKYYRMAFLVVAAFCAALAVMFLLEGPETFRQAVAYFLLGILMLVLRAFYPEVAAWRTKRAIKRHPVTDLFVIEEDGVQIARGEDKAFYPYEECNALLETEMALYLFHNKGRGLTIAKRGVQGATPEQLRELLERRCGVKARWMGRAHRETAEGGTD